MSEREHSHIGLALLVLLVYAICLILIGTVASQVRDLQRRVGQLEAQQVKR